MNADEVYEELLRAQSGSPTALPSSLPSPLIVDPVGAVDEKPDSSLETAQDKPAHPLVRQHKAWDNKPGIVSEFGDVAGTVLKTIRDLPDAAARGLVTGGAEATYAAGLIDEDQIIRFRSFMKAGSNIAKGEGVEPITAGLVESVGQIAPAAIPVFKGLRALGVARTLAMLVAEAVGGALGFNPDEPNIANLVKDNVDQGELLSVVTDLMATDPNDPDAVNRIRNGVQDLTIGGVFEGLVAGVPKAVQRFKQGKSPVPMGMSIEDVGSPTMREMISRPATDLDPQGFYSAVSRAVDNLPMEKGGAAQMRAMIAKGEGVKADEMSWIGLDDFLKGKKNVTKQEIRDFLDANQVEIREVVLGGETSDQLISQANSLMSQGQTLQASGDLEGARRLFDQHDALMRRAEGIESSPEGQLTPKHSDPTLNLPGGENYREVLLTLPRIPRSEVRPSKTASAPFVEEWDRLTLEINTTRDGLNQARLANSPEYASIMDRVNVLERSRDTLHDKMVDATIAESPNRFQVGEKFTAGHFDEDNVLAHIRLNDRTGPNGEKILFIEEIQSDWHQKGRKQGYATGDKYPADYVEGYRQEMLEDPKFTGKELTDQEVIDHFDLRPADSRAVPDAPLKKTWHETSLRRVIRMAAEEGYDTVAWTPGKIQAERYDLSNQVDALKIERIRGGEKDGQYLVKGRRGASTYPFFTTAVPENQLADVIGKDLAEKAVKDASKNPDGIEYTGLDLQVGGEGMKGFYDKMLKTYAEKFGKKFGAKVGVTKIGAGGPAAVLEVVEIPGGAFTVVDRTPPLGRGDHVADFATRSEADIFIKKELADTKVWTIPITPEMRESVMKKGVPLFSAAGATAAAGAAMQEDRQAGDLY
jgi:hypothetical protein